MSESEKWKLPPIDQITGMSDDEIRGLIHAFIEHAERGNANVEGGGRELAITRAQYLTQELAQRNQDRQTKVMIAQAGDVRNYTIAIGIMTLVILLANLWPLVHAH